VPKRTWVRPVGIAAWLAVAFAARAEDAIRVYYDGRDCGTDVIEVQAYDRAARAWLPHPIHPRVRVDSCQPEEAGGLWNELRWRCPAPASDPVTGWRPLQVFDADVMSRCADDTLASANSRTKISVASPADGSTVRARERNVLVRGTVDVDGIAGSDYDVVLLVDRAAPEEAFGAQIAAARAYVRRLTPRLGAVRFAVLSYPTDKTSSGARRELAWSVDPRAIDRALAGLSQRELVSRHAVAGALDAALRELGSARRSARPMIVMGVDGRRLDSTAKPAADDPLLRATARVATRGAALHWVALGGLVPEDPALVRRALEDVRGSFRRVPPQSFATSFFDAIVLPVAEEVWVETARGAELPEVSATLQPDGAFRARVPLARGANTLVIHARTSDGAVLGRRLRLVFDDSLVPQGARTPQRKEIEIQPER
jgi:hypothetical protein